MNPKKRVYLKKGEKKALNLEVAEMNNDGDMDGMCKKEAAEILSKKLGFNVRKIHVLKALSSISKCVERPYPKSKFLLHVPAEGPGDGVTLGQIKEHLKAGLGMIDRYRAQELKRIE